MEDRIMNDPNVLLERCKELGATLFLKEGKVRVEAPEPLPDDFVIQLRESKEQILFTLKHNSRKEAQNSLLEQWRKIAIPEWRRVLKLTLYMRDKPREEYARWMLKDLLHDPEYREEE
jgi:hypothetical protein